ncbi:MAG: hypothetical protein ACR2PI_24870 [Hyphomicrobiaceae bacterium]
MKRFLVGYFFLAISLVLLQAQPLLAGDLLTVTGKIGATNRGAFDAFDDAFFKHHERTFKKAYAFDRAALKALPQHQVQAQVEGWPRAVRAAGPRLSDVLAMAKVAAGAKLSVMALDGYAAVFEPTDVASRDWIVAIEANGKPLGIGGRGPAWLMYDTAGKTIKADAEAKWVWSAFMIIAE